MYDDKVIQGLAHLRTYARKYPTMAVSESINALDNAGVFAVLDEQTDYAAAEDILADVTPARPVDEPLYGATAYRRHIHVGCGLDCNR